MEAGLEDLMGIDPELQWIQESAMGDDLHRPRSQASFSEDISENTSETDYDDSQVLPSSSKQNKNHPSLMSLLSGKQTKQKGSRKRQSKKLQEPKQHLEFVTQSDNTTEADDSTLADTSFDALEYEKDYQRQQALDDLEAKIYQSRKRMTARDFLSAPPPQKSKMPKVQDVGDDVEILSESPAPVIESVQPKSVPAVFAKDILTSHRPRRKRKAGGGWSLPVSLKLRPSVLAEFKKQENPLHEKGNESTKGVSMLSALMSRQTPRKMVTLKLPSPFLKEIQQMLSPFYTRTSGRPAAKNVPSVFDMMMNSATNADNPKLTPLQKAKELWPPPLHRSQLHVYVVEDDRRTLSLQDELPRSRKSDGVERTDDDSLDSLISLQPPDPLASLLKSSNIRKTETIIDPHEHVLHRAPLVELSSAHKRIYNDFIVARKQSNELMWPFKFAPPGLDSLLSSRDTIFCMKRWILNAFAILKTQSTKTPRNVKIRDRQRKQRQREAAGLLGFVVDDEDDGDETEEDIFVPIMILQGGRGSGKSAAIYAAMNALDGYVNEINSGQNRSRRDLYGPLKEFCTSQIINKSGGEKSFQKGIVLFEDCDVLFEQDKTFWTVVQDVLNLSRRPIVLTVENADVVPKSIWEHAEEQESIFCLQNNDEKAFKQYLWLCCFSQGFDLSEDYLRHIAASCWSKTGLDLRKGLTECQWICSGSPKEENTFFKMSSISQPSVTKFDDLATLESMSGKADLMSASDVIAENTTSLLPGKSVPNELLDQYIIDDTSGLRPRPANFETNIGEYLQKMEPEALQTLHKMTFNKLRNTTLDFLESREKKLPKILQDYQIFRSVTRSRSLEQEYDQQPPPELQGLPDTSICYSMTKTPFILDLASFSRNWGRFQQKLLKSARDSGQSDETMLSEWPTGWRSFRLSVKELLDCFTND